MFVHHIVSTYGVCYNCSDCKFDYLFRNSILILKLFLHECMKTGRKKIIYSSHPYASLFILDAKRLRKESKKGKLQRNTFYRCNWDHLAHLLLTWTPILLHHHILIFLRSPRLSHHHLLYPKGVLLPLCQNKTISFQAQLPFHPRFTRLTLCPRTDQHYPQSRCNHPQLTIRKQEPQTLSTKIRSMLWNAYDHGHLLILHHSLPFLYQEPQHPQRQHPLRLIRSMIPQ